MPKSLFEIRTFQHGIISTPSETDIPQEAATFSVDVDPILEGGKLGGMPGHTEETDSASASIPADQMCFIEAKNGTRTLAYVDHSATALKYITDFEGTRGAISTSSPAFDADDDYAALAVHGHEVHIGMGPTKDTKWYGYVTNDQFGSNTCGTIPEYLDAKLERFDDVTDIAAGMHKVITVDNGDEAHIAIKYKDNNLYSFAPNTTTQYTVEVTGLATEFVSLQAICKDPTEDSHFFIYDNDDTTYGTVYRVNMSSLASNTITLDVVKSIVINGWGTAGLEEPEEYEVSDMISDNHTYSSGSTYTNCYLYFAMHKENGGVPVVALRSEDPDEVYSLNEEFRVGYPTLIFRSSGSHPQYNVSNNGMDTYNVTPTLRGDDREGTYGDYGHFYLADSVDNDYHRFDIHTIKTPFFNCGVVDNSASPTNGAELIGYLFSSSDVTTPPRLKTYDTDGGTKRSIGLSAMILRPFTVYVDYTDRGNYHFGSSHARLIQFGDSSYNKNAPPFNNVIVKNASCCLYDNSLYPGVDYICLSVSTGTSTRLAIYDASHAYDIMYSATKSWDTLYGNLWGFGSIGGISTAPTTESQTSTPLGSITLYDDNDGAGTVINFVQGDLSGTSGEIALDILDATTISFGATSFNEAPDVVCTAAQSSGQDADGIRAGEILTYHIALEYDGYQIAPMSEPIATITPSEDGKPIIVNLYLQESAITDISPRVSGAYILRGTKNSLVGTSFASIPRVVERLDFSVSKNEVSFAGTSGYYKYQVYDRNRLGETFEQLSGYSADAEVCTPNYGISCVGNDQLLVGDCQGFDGECDSTNIIYLSEPGKYDQFNLSTNFVILSDKPTAMCFWRGKFYVFSSSKMWRINPNGPYIEDDFEGIGVEGPQGVIANEFGIFVAGVKGVYLDVGSGFMPIGDTILNSEGVGSTFGWLNHNPNLPPVVFFDAERKAFCAAVDATSSGYRQHCFAYSVGTKRWDIWSITNYSLRGMLIGRNGKTYAAVGSKVYSLFDDKSSRRSYVWYSKVLDMGANSKDKKFYEIRIPYQGTWSAGTITAEDHDGNSISLTDASVTGMKVLTCNTRDRGFKIKLASVTGSCLIDSIGVVYRHLSGVH